IGGHHIAGSALKFCLVAEGIADLYPRLGRTMEWDTAAGHAVVLAAGGCVTTLDGAELGYGKPGFDNPHFVARGRVDLARHKIAFCITPRRSACSRVLAGLDFSL